jgi:hypothetical protein
MHVLGTRGHEERGNRGGSVARVTNAFPDSGGQTGGPFGAVDSDVRQTIEWLGKELAGKVPQGVLMALCRSVEADRARAKSAEKQAERKRLHWHRVKHRSYRTIRRREEPTLEELMRVDPVAAQVRLEELARRHCAGTNAFPFGSGAPPGSAAKCCAQIAFGFLVAGVGLLYEGVLRADTTRFWLLEPVQALAQAANGVLSGRGGDAAEGARLREAASLLRRLTGTSSYALWHLLGALRKLPSWVQIQFFEDPLVPDPAEEPAGVAGDRDRDRGAGGEPRACAVPDVVILVRPVDGAVVGEEPETFEQELRMAAGTSDHQFVLEAGVVHRRDKEGHYLMMQQLDGGGGSDPRWGLRDEHATALIDGEPRLAFQHQGVVHTVVILVYTRRGAEPAPGEVVQEAPGEVVQQAPDETAVPWQMDMSMRTMCRPLHVRDDKLWGTINALGVAWLRVVDLLAARWPWLWDRSYGRHPARVLWDIMHWVRWDSDMATGWEAELTRAARCPTLEAAVCQLLRAVYPALVERGALAPGAPLNLVCQEKSAAYCAFAPDAGANWLREQKQFQAVTTLLAEAHCGTPESLYTRMSRPPPVAGNARQWLEEVARLPPWAFAEENRETLLALVQGAMRTYALPHTSVYASLGGLQFPPGGERAHWEEEVPMPMPGQGEAIESRAVQRHRPWSAPDRKELQEMVVSGHSWDEIAARFDCTIEGARSEFRRLRASPPQNVQPRGPPQYVRPMGPPQNVRPMLPPQYAQPMGPPQYVRPMGPPQYVQVPIGQQQLVPGVQAPIWPAASWQPYVQPRGPGAAAEEEPEEAGEGADESRSATRSREWTRDEDLVLVQGANGGESNEAIADRLPNRNLRAVENRIARLRQLGRLPNVADSGGARRRQGGTAPQMAVPPAMQAPLGPRQYVQAIGPPSASGQPYVQPADEDERVVGRWTPAQEERLRELWEKGWKPARIAPALGRRVQAIKDKLRELRRRARAD